MPELKDVDDKYIYWQPDDGGAIQRTARTEGTDKIFNVDAFKPVEVKAGSADLTAEKFTPTEVKVAAGPDGALGPTEKGIPPNEVPDPDVKVTHTPGAPVVEGLKVTHSPDAIDAKVESEANAGANPLPAPTGPTGERELVPGQPQLAGTPGVSTPPSATGSSSTASPPASTTTSKPAAATAGPTAQQQLFKAMRDEKAAQGKLTDLTAQAEDEKAFAMAVDANAREKFMGDQAQKQATRDRVVKEGNDYLDVLNKDVREGKIDPDGYFAEKGIGARIGAAIAMGLGQFAATMTGGQNTAMQIINDQVARHVEAQKVALHQKGVAAEAQREKIAMLRQQGFDEAQIDQALFLGGLEASKAKLAATIQASSSDVVRANGAAMLAKMDENIAATKIKFAAAAQAAALKYSPKNFNELLAAQKFDREMSQDKKERMVRLADGSPAFAPTKEDATKLKESDENRIAMTGNIQRLKQIVAQKTPFDGETRDEAKRITTDLMTQFGVMRKLGALSDSDRELADQFRDPTAFFTGDKKILDSLSKYEGRINAGHNAMLKARLVAE